MGGSLKGVEQAAAVTVAAMGRVDVHAFDFDDRRILTPGSIATARGRYLSHIPHQEQPNRGDELTGSGVVRVVGEAVPAELLDMKRGDQRHDIRMVVGARDKQETAGSPWGIVGAARPHDLDNARSSSGKKSATQRLRVRAARRRRIVASRL